MVGNGQAYPLQPTAIFDSSVEYYTTAGSIDGSGGVTESGQESNSWVKLTSYTSNTGPEKGCARMLAKAGHKVAVVKFARNGRPIGEWLSSGDFYTYWRPFFTDRKAELEARGYTVRVAFLWQQGHANRESTAGYYAVAFAELLADVRSLSGDQPVPFAIARQHIDTTSTQSISVLRAEQVAAADADTLGSWYNLDDLTLRDGTTHLDSLGFTAAGVRAGESIIALIDTL